MTVVSTFRPSLKGFNCFCRSVKRVDVLLFNVLALLFEGGTHKILDDCSLPLTGKNCVDLIITEKVVSSNFEST